MHPVPDLLGGPRPANRVAQLNASTALTAAVAVAGTCVAVAGITVLAFLSGGGPQPEDVVPAGALAFAKVDLDPAANQKVAVYRLAERFPASADSVDDEGAVKDQLLGTLLESAFGIGYAADVAPWIGDRAGVAALPSGAAEPDALVVVAHRDRAAAQAALDRLNADGQLFFGFSDRADYVLLGDSQAAVDRALSAPSVLADDDGYADAVGALDGDQLLTAWADVAAIWAALPADTRQSAAEVSGGAVGVSPRGHVAVGVRADERYIEVQGRAVDLESGGLSGLGIGTDSGVELLDDLPASTVAALSVTGFGDEAVALYGTTVGLAGDPGPPEPAEGTGLRLPEDLRVLLGEETLLALLGEDQVAMRTRSDDPGDFAVAQRLEQLGGEGAADVVLRDLDDGVALGSSPAALDAVAAGDGGLVHSDRFRRAVPDADDAGLVLYVDVAGALELQGSDGDLVDRRDVEPVEAVGLTATGGEDGGFRLRITVR